MDCASDLVAMIGPCHSSCRKALTRVQKTKDRNFVLKVSAGAFYILFDDLNIENSKLLNIE